MLYSLLKAPMGAAGKPTVKKTCTHILTAALAAALLLSGCARQAEKTPAPSQTPGVSPMHTAVPVPVHTPAPSPTLTPTPTPVPAPSPLIEPADEDLVVVTDYIDGVLVELKYATDDNFTGQVIYDFTEARLRYGTVKKLAQVQRELAGQDMGLKIWDAFRPVSAQFKLWEVCPDPAFVANPNTGHSSHSRGNTVDITLVTAQGADVEMPTGFDDFTPAADRDYTDLSQAAAEHAELLQGVMEAHGFSGYFSEWWHYTDCDAYPVYEQAIQ